MTEHSQSMNEDDSERHRVVETNRLKEARAVFWSRALVLGVLVASATTFAVATYYYCANEEQAGFQNQYANYAEEIIHVSQENVRKVFGHLKALSVATTSQVLNDPNVNWPFTTLPDFEVRGATARNSSQAIIIALLPMVSDADRAEWEAYSQSHQGWIQESHGESQLGGTPMQPIAEEIYRRQELNDSTKIPVPDPEGAGPYAPVWQLSPPPPLNDTTTINLNLFEKPVFKKAVDFANYTRTATFLDVCHQTAWFGKAMGDINHDLQTVVVQPVFSDFSPNAQIVAHYVAVIPWESFFREILPPHSECVTVVMSNTCDEVFSLEVEGSDARVVSRDSDARDPRYDNMVQSEIFADFANSKELLEAGLGEHCVYTISTYPTQEFENQHITNEPIWYTIVSFLDAVPLSVSRYLDRSSHKSCFPKLALNVFSGCGCHFCIRQPRVWPVRLSPPQAAAPPLERERGRAPPQAPCELAVPRQGSGPAFARLQRRLSLKWCRKQDQSPALQLLNQQLSRLRRPAHCRTLPECDHYVCRHCRLHRLVQFERAGACFYLA